MPHTTTDRLTVLFVGDDPAFARTVREYVERESPGQFDIEVMDRLSAGIVRLMRGGVDLVLLDLNLPDSRGLDTYVTVRTQAPDVAAVVLAGEDDEGLALAAAREGAQDYLVKGQVSGDGLVRCLHYAFERQQGLVQLKQYARRLSASEGRARRIIENNVDAIVVADREGRVRYTNRSAEVMFGRSADDLLDRVFDYSLEDGQTSEILVQGPPEQVVEMRVVTTSWDDQPALMALLRDVTQRRRATELRAQLEAEALAVKELRRLDRMKSEFMINVTQELVAPLPPLRAAVDDLLSGAQGEMPRRQREVLRLLSRHVAELSRFAGGVQALSRLDSGRYDVQLGDLALVPLIEAEVGRIHSATGERRVGTEHALNEGARVRADRDAVQRVVRHLVDNAFTHNPAGTDILVRTAPVDADTVEVAVVDTGRGIPSDQRDHVFDAFYQTSPDGSSLGAGIGLALCKALVERMGGTISVQSQPGEGAQVRFTLRAAPPTG